MKDISNIYQKSSDWMDGSGPLSDIVISSRIRLARNVAGFVFRTNAEDVQQQEVLNFLHKNIMQTELGDYLHFLNMGQVRQLERQMLSERQLISKRLLEGDGWSGVALSLDESLAIMINEEDHIRMQVLASGLQLDEVYQTINRIDDLLEDKIDYAFSEKYGYLTACPTNVGTGIRVSVMLHLPALKMTGQIEKVFRAARELKLAVRGLYGEGTEPLGDFFQLSNQTTLGKSESQIIEELIALAVEPIVEYERRARDKLLSDRMAVLDDKIYRALGVLQNARLISSDEVAYLLSVIRLGIHLNRIDDIDLRTVNTVFQLTQPAHLQNHFAKELTAGERDEARARFIREQLG